MKRIVTALFLLAAVNCTAQDFKPTIGIDGNTFAPLPTTSIAALGSSIVGFTATRNTGVATNTTMNITAVITKNSGGDTNALNNTSVLQTIAN